MDNRSEFTGNDPVYNAARGRIALSLVGFVNASLKDGSDRPCAGSGTLARIDDARGVLTAAHVVDGLQKLPSVGIVRFTGPNRQSANLSMGHVRCVVIGDEPWSQNGPDLAFMILPHDLASALQAHGCVFLDLGRRQTELIHQQEEKKGIYLLAGMVGEKTTRVEHSPTAARIAGGGLVDLINVSEPFERESFDYVQCDSLPEKHFVPPESYEGMSGGGLFVAEMAGDEANAELAGIIPLGVSFWQSDTVEGNRTITCHWANSVYIALVEEVRRQLKGA
jgi:hypothetical protein